MSWRTPFLVDGAAWFARVYTVLFHDLETVDSVKTLVAALSHLDRVANDVFDKINTRVSSYRTQVGSINARIEAAQKQVARLSENTGRATVVIATPRFPGADEVKHYESVFAGMAYASEPPELFDEAEEDESALPAEPAQAINTGAKERDHLRLYWGLQSDEAAKEQEPLDDQGEAKGGLGRFPTHMPSVSNVLLFNSNENPYKEYATLDNLLGEVVDSDDEGDEEEKEELAAAPTTLIDGDDGPEVAQLEFIFKPKMRDLQQFDLAANLALPNVADLTYEHTAGADDSIAPTVFQANLPALPTIMDLQPPPAIADSGAPAAAGGSTPAAPASAPPPPASAPPPPPPPPAAAAPAPAAAPAAAAPEGPVAPPAAPPPPEVPAAAAAPGRMSLMDQIRQGKALKKAKPKKEESDSGSEAGGDGDSKPAAAPAGGGALSMMEQIMKRRQDMMRSGASKPRQGRRSTVAVTAVSRLTVLAGDKKKDGDEGKDAGGAGKARPSLPSLGESKPAEPAAAAPPAPSGDTGMFNPDSMPGWASTVRGGGGDDDSGTDESSWDDSDGE